MKKRAGRQRRSREEIAELLEDLGQSELSQAAFAAERGLPLSTLQYWLRQSREGALGRVHRGRTPSRAAELVPVRIVDAAPASSATLLELESEHGYRLRFPAGLSPDLLARYVEALAPRC